jgi:hypothetical protein
MSMGLTAKPPSEPEVTAGSSPPCESDLTGKKLLIAVHRGEPVLNESGDGKLNLHCFLRQSGNNI